MTRTPPDTPFEIDLNEPAICGVSNRLEKRIRLQFAGVLIGGAAARVTRHNKNEKEYPMDDNNNTICDCCGEEIDRAEANYDAFGYGVLCNECYAEALAEQD